MNFDKLMKSISEPIVTPDNMLTDQQILNTQIRKIRSYFDRIRMAVGKAKEPEIEACFKDEEVLNALILLLDPLVVFHLQDKSINRQVNMDGAVPFGSFFDMLRHLATKRALDHSDIARVKMTLRMIENSEDLTFVKLYLTKTLRLGVTAKTVNKVAGTKLVSEFTCMLANKYFDHPDVIGSGQKFAVTEKLDGIRCLAICADGSAPVLYSRQGQQIEGLVEIEEDLCRLMENWSGVSFVLDGELLISDRESIPSKEQYKRTTKIVRTDAPEKRGVTFNVFDYITFSEYRDQVCAIRYVNRRDIIDVIFGKVACSHVKPVPILYRGDSVDEMLRCLNEQRSQGHEGVMINLMHAPYEFKRTNALLKVKVMNDCDLMVTGVQEGTGKFAGMCGALTVDYKGNPVGVGSGISDQLRREIWQNPEAYIGRIITVQYFEETQDKDGKLSIRFPVFKEFREDGKEVSYS